jgi:hypothetical protein
VTGPIDPLADPKVQRHRAELEELAKRGDSDARNVRAQELQRLQEREPRRDDDVLWREAQARRKETLKPDNRDELRQGAMTRAGVRAVLERARVRPGDESAVKAALEAEFEEQGRREQEFQGQQVAGPDVSEQPGKDADRREAAVERGRSGTRMEREQSGRRQPSRSREDRIKEREGERAKHWQEQADLSLSKNLDGLELL